MAKIFEFEVLGIDAVISNVDRIKKDLDKQIQESMETLNRDKGFLDVLQEQVKAGQRTMEAAERALLGT